MFFVMHKVILKSKILNKIKTVDDELKNVLFPRSIYGITGRKLADG